MFLPETLRVPFRLQLGPKLAAGNAVPGPTIESDRLAVPSTWRLPPDCASFPNIVTCRKVAFPNTAMPPPALERLAPAKLLATVVSLMVAAAPAPTVMPPPAANDKPE